MKEKWRGEVERGRKEGRKSREGDQRRAKRRMKKEWREKQRKGGVDIAEGGRRVVNKGVEKGWKGWGGGR